VQVHRLLTADPAAEVTLGLQLDTTAGGRVTLTALLDGERLPLLVDWQAEKGHWIGAEVGLFATALGMVHHRLEDRRASFAPGVGPRGEQGSLWREDVAAPRPRRWPRRPGSPVRRSPGCSTSIRRSIPGSGPGCGRPRSASSTGPTPPPATSPPGARARSR